MKFSFKIIRPRPTYFRSLSSIFVPRGPATNNLSSEPMMAEFVLTQICVARQRLSKVLKICVSKIKVNIDSSSYPSPCLYLKQCWHYQKVSFHYDDVIMTMLPSQITSLTVVYSIVHSGVNQRKHQSSASLAFVREIHRRPVNFPHKWPVTRKMFPFDDVIMCSETRIKNMFVLEKNISSCRLLSFGPKQTEELWNKC